MSRPFRGDPAGSARACLHRRREHCYRVLDMRMGSPIGSRSSRPTGAPEGPRHRGSRRGYRSGGQDATKTIPIVCWVVGSIRRGRPVESLVRPGGNVTGNLSLPYIWAGSGWSWSKKLFPTCPCRVLTIRPLRPCTRGERGSPVVARALGLTVRPWGTATDGFQRVFAALNRERRMDSM